MRLATKGDTIIEVMFAFAIFSLVAVGSITVMNQGISSAQRSLETTLVRQQMDAQAEAIRFIHQSYVANYHTDASLSGTAAEWENMTVNHGSETASEFGVEGQTCPDSAPGENPFVVNARTAEVWSSEPSMYPSDGSMPPFAQVFYGGTNNIQQAYGIWVEAVPSDNDTGPGFVDFHIRACWEALGSSVPATLGTIVRLYEPRF